MSTFYPNVNFFDQKMNNTLKISMSCPNCVVREGKCLCKKQGYKPCIQIKCPLDRDNYDDNYGLND